MNHDRNCGFQSVRPDALLAAAVAGRRPLGSTAWMHEVAALLRMAVSTGMPLGGDMPEPLTDFYASTPDTCASRPADLLLRLSIWLDLEDLGFGQMRAEHLCRALVAARLLDRLDPLEQAQAEGMLARRLGGRLSDAGKAALVALVIRSATFGFPDGAAARHVTQAVTVLAETGSGADVPKSALTRCLTLAGVMALLDRNDELLARVCIAQEQVGLAVPAPWIAAVGAAHDACRILPTQEPQAEDALAVWLATGWARRIAGRPGFAQRLPLGAFRVEAAPRSAAVLADVARLIGAQAQLPWSDMREPVTANLSAEGGALLQAAEQSVIDFDAEIAIFLRGYAPISSAVREWQHAG